MAGYRFCISLLVTFTVAFTASAQTVPGESAAQEPGKSGAPESSGTAITKVYALSDLGHDPNLCKWVAETIPQMIQPTSWTNGGGQHSLSYYAPGKVLVVCHTPAVHAQVDEFIQGLKKAMPPRPMQPGVMQAQFTPDAPRVGPLVSSSQAYPIPMQATTPKHLFHFIIRYEGEGIIDSNVTKFAQALTDAQRETSGPTQSYRFPPSYAPAPGTVVPSSGTSPFGAPTMVSPKQMPLADGPIQPATLVSPASVSGQPLPLPSVPTPPSIPPAESLPR